MGTRMCFSSDVWETSQKTHNKQSGEAKALNAKPVRTDAGMSKGNLSAVSQLHPAHANQMQAIFLVSCQAPPISIYGFVTRKKESFVIISCSASLSSLGSEVDLTRQQTTIRGFLAGTASR